MKQASHRLGYILSSELMESCNWRAVSISISGETHFSQSRQDQERKRKNPLFLAVNGFHLSHETT